MKLRKTMFLSFVLGVLSIFYRNSALASDQSFAQILKNNSSQTIYELIEPILRTPSGREALLILAEINPLPDLSSIQSLAIEKLLETSNEANEQARIVKIISKFDKKVCEFLRERAKLESTHSYLNDQKNKMELSKKSLSAKKERLIKHHSNNPTIEKLNFKIENLNSKIQRLSKQIHDIQQKITFLNSILQPLEQNYTFNSVIFSF